jgi:hypothetical protein
MGVNDRTNTLGLNIEHLYQKLIYPELDCEDIKSFTYMTKIFKIKFKKYMY